MQASMQANQYQSQNHAVGQMMHPQTNIMSDGGRRPMYYQDQNIYMNRNAASATVSLSKNPNGPIK